MSCTIWLCPNCGSPEVEATAWVLVNDMERIVAAPGQGQRAAYWCRNCEESPPCLDEHDSPLSHDEALAEASEKALFGVEHQDECNPTERI